MHQKYILRYVLTWRIDFRVIIWVTHSYIQQKHFNGLDVAIHSQVWNVHHICRYLCCLLNRYALKCLRFTKFGLKFVEIGRSMLNKIPLKHESIELIMVAQPKDVPMVPMNPQQVI